MILFMQKEKSVLFLLFFLFIGSLTSGAQQVRMCSETFPEFGLNLDFPCGGKTIQKDANSFSKSFELKDNNGTLMEQVNLLFIKYPVPVTPTDNMVNQLREDIEKDFKAAMKNYVSATGMSDYQVLPLKSNEQELSPGFKIIYATRTAMATAPGKKNVYVYFSFEYYFKHGKIIAKSRALLTKVSKYLFDERSFSTDPTLFLNIKEPYLVTHSKTLLSFELREENLVLKDLPAENGFLIDNAGITDQNRSQFKIKQPILVRLVKKIPAGQTFATATAAMVKGQPDIKTNPSDWKTNSAVPNIVLFLHYGTYSNGQRSQFGYPYRVLFEFDKTIYEIVADKKDCEYQELIIKRLIETLKKSAAGNTATAPAQSEAFNRELLLGMEAWLKDYLASSKGEELKTNTLGALMTKRFQSTLKLQQYPSVILEEGLTPDKRRDWLVTLGSFSNKEAALPVMQQWTVYFKALQHELFQLKPIKQTAESVLWMPVPTATSGLPAQFSKLELHLLIKEIFLAENGKMVTKYEVQLRMGSKL